MKNKKPQRLNNNFNEFTKRTRDYLFRMISYAIIGAGIAFIFYWTSQIPLESKDRWTVIIGSMAITATIMIGDTNRHFQYKQLQTTSLFKVFELLSSPEIRKSRKRVHDKYCELKNNSKIIFRGTDVEEDADKVLSAFDQVSATVVNGLLNIDLFFDTYGEMIVRDWKTLKDEIELRQTPNKKTLRHFTLLKNEFEIMLRKNPEYKDSDTDPYCNNNEEILPLSKGIKLKHD